MIIRVAGAVISSPYGAIDAIRDYRPHNGIDLPFNEGTELGSIGDGVIKGVADLGNEGLGKGVFVELQDGSTAIYGHLSEVLVKTGDKIKFGETIGLSGNTGNSSGAHLHFAIKDPSGEFIDPTPLADVVENLSGGAEVTETGAGVGSWLMDKYNGLADDVVGWQTETILKPIGYAIKEISIEVWDWFVLNLPDIMGYTTILAGVLIILGSMFGKGGMMKPVSIWAGLMILSFCILAGARGGV